MELTTTKDDLVRELAVVEQVASRRPTIPILGSVLCEADLSGVRLSATDTEIGVRTRLPATVQQPGVLALPVRKLYELARSLPAGEVRLALDNKGVGITAGGFSARLQAQSPDDFPRLAMPEASDAALLTLPGDLLRQLSMRTRFAAKEGDARYYLGGVRLEASNGLMRMVATDGHRLALAEASLSQAKKAETGPAPVLIPRKTVDALIAMLPDANAPDVTFTLGENHLFFAVGEDRLLISRQVEGQFPDYARIVPKSASVRAEVGRTVLIEALRRVLVVSPDQRVVFAVSQDGLGLDASSAEVGSALESLAVNYVGLALDPFGLNAEYVLQFLDSIDADAVTVEREGTGGIVWRPVGGDVTGVYVMMPINR